MLGIGKYAQNWFYMEYSIYTQILGLWIKGCHFFRNCMLYATRNKSFCLGLTSINEVRNQVDYIPDKIFVFFYQWSYNVVVYDV